MVIVLEGPSTRTIYLLKRLPWVHFVVGGVVAVLVVVGGFDLIVVIVFFLCGGFFILFNWLTLSVLQLKSRDPVLCL